MIAFYQYPIIDYILKSYFLIKISFTYLTCKKTATSFYKPVAILLFKCTNLLP